MTVLTKPDIITLFMPPPDNFF